MPDLARIVDGTDVDIARRLPAPAAGVVSIAPCTPHVPTSNTEVLAWGGVALAVLVAVGLSWHFVAGLRRGVRMRSQNGLLDDCSSEELAVILAHEQAHRRRRDNLRLLLGHVFCLALPRSWRKAIVHDLHLLCEQSCDFSAAERFGSLTAAQTLVQIGRILHRSSTPHQGLAFDGSDLGCRVHALLRLDSRRLLKLWHIAALLTVSCLLVLLAVEPLHHGDEWVIVVLEQNVIMAHH